MTTTPPHITAMLDQAMAGITPALDRLTDVARVRCAVMDDAAAVATLSADLGNMLAPAQLSALAAAAIVRLAILTEGATR
jgi:hypothetical protein